MSRSVTIGAGRARSGSMAPSSLGSGTAAQVPPLGVTSSQSRTSVDSGSRLPRCLLSSLYEVSLFTL